MGEVIPLRPGLTGSAAAKGSLPTRLDAPQVEERSAGARLEATPAPDSSEFAPIEDASLKALGRKGMSRRELERVLGAQGYHQFAIADELERLEGVGLIDDYALAQHLVAHLQERKGLTGGAIKAELVKRVVAPGAIAYAMDLIDTADELAMAREIAAKRARQYGALDATTVERRLTAFLLRRGFSSTTVRAAVASVRSA
ncbi:MAG TPA: regulatory protein RecX [Microbacteriaceae bacterium]|nr:regulatory protein RecX [Microbacteriaceae bacterium]